MNKCARTIESTQRHKGHKEIQKHSPGDLCVFVLFLKLSEDPHDHALHFDLIEKDRRHRAVRGLQADLSVVPIESLERRLAVLEKRHHRLPVVRRAAPLDDHVVSVADMVLDHRVAAHLEREIVLPLLENAQHVEIVRMGDRLDGLPGRDLPRHLQAARWRQDLDRASAVVAPLDVSRLLELPEMAEDRDFRDAEMVGDLLERRRIAVPQGIVLDVLQDFQLLRSHLSFFSPSSPKSRLNCMGLAGLRSGGRPKPLSGIFASPFGTSNSASAISCGLTDVTSNSSTTRSMKST